MTAQHEILEKISLDSKKGVDYYNTDNKENKDKRDNILTDRENDFSHRSLGIEADASQKSRPEDEVKRQGALPCMRVAATAPTPLDTDQIKSCVFQLFDNGEASTQRYKYKLRLNLTDGTNPEFIASLTKDLRNFKKHVPGVNRLQIIEEAQNIRRHIKKTHGHLPFVGKLHTNPGRGLTRRTIQIEPDTLVAIWWDPEERGWSGIVRIQNWVHEFDLFEQHVTLRQKSQGVKAQDNWQNPAYDTRVRPETWAETRHKAV